MSSAEIRNQYHPSAHTQTALNIHTHREHTPGAGQPYCCGAWGAVGRLVLAQGSYLSRGIEGGFALVIHSKIKMAG